MEEEIQSTESNENVEIIVNEINKPRISSNLKKSFAHLQNASTAEEKEQKSEENEGLIVDGEIRILHEIPETKEILCIAYTENHQLLAIGLVNGAIRLFSFKSGENVAILQDDEIIQYSNPVTAIKHRPVKSSHPVTQTLISTLGDDTKVILYDEETKTMERIFQSSGTPEFMNGHKSRVFSACFNPSSNHELVSGGWDDTIQFWDIRQPFSQRYIGGVHICGEAIDISQNGKEILTCSWQEKNPLQLWDYSSGKLIANLQPDAFESYLYAGKFINSKYYVCGGSDNNYIRIVDRQMHLTICGVRNLPGGVYSIDIGPMSGRKTKSSNLPRITFCSGKTVYELEST
ncbi:uncharacterized protein LOC127289427 isoform X2 [Leptopilina boulardi]|uniref:uncharacterized protein LOC127289427 isoform X2 n=1 Tax=Leptopilina boulardi TaxID=63433 RepID=UPI0021F5D20F|nr:uncharacterized protein LOC127289427 isoform X2 [Leptopilina boulardi]